MSNNSSTNVTYHCRTQVGEEFAMKKLLCVMVSAAMLLFCACSGAKSGQSLREGTALSFPGTNWNMNMDEVMNACGFTDADDLQVSDDDCAPAFLVSDREVFGETATTLSFSFVNLKAVAQDSETASAPGEEVLAGVTVIYPAGADLEKVRQQLDSLYGKSALNEITVFSPYSPLDSDTLSGQKQTASDTTALWGTPALSSEIGGKDKASFQEKWPAFQPGLTAEDWESFSDEARFVTIVCEEGEEFSSVQFYAYNLNVYNELSAQMDTE